MVSQKLVEYVQSEALAGKNKEEISRALVASGWAQPDIDEAFLASSGGLPKSEQVGLPPSVHVEELAVNNQNQGKEVAPTTNNSKAVIVQTSIGLLILILVSLFS